MSEVGPVDQNKLRALMKMALHHSRAQQTEVRVASGRWLLTRFANSSIHQNMASANACMRVRAVFGKKVATGNTNQLNEEGVKKLVDDVVRMARLQDENKDFVSLPEPMGPFPDVKTFYQSTSDVTPDRQANAVQAIVGEADKTNATAAGSFYTRVYEHAVMNSLGIDTSSQSTASSLLTVITAPDGGFGYASASDMDVDRIDPQSIGLEAAARADSSRNPIDLEPGEYECILLPYAVSELLRMFHYMSFDALSYQEGRSALAGKLGKKIVSDKIDLVDDATDPRTIRYKFDSEGIPKQRVVLIENGVATGLLYDSYSAHKVGKQSNGHAFWDDYELGGGWSNVVMRTGDATLEDMIRSTKRGVLVSRFHYTNIAHLMSATITGMTRDGTFLIEDGKITAPVKNLRFTQSITAALSDTEMIGGDPKLSSGIVAPAIKVKRFRFSSGTQF